mgnify:CR=1 FL=1
MSILQQNANTPLYSHPLLVGFIYAIIIRLFICPWDFDVSTDLIGFLGTDTLDTLSLRWAFWHPESHFFPIGWDATKVTPNIFDHLLFVPLLHLPFPMADNLWWLSQLWVSLVCAHMYGHCLSENQSSGWMGGVTLIVCDSLLRELNWGHAPQAMWWAPLCTLIALERWQQTHDRRWMFGSGIALGVSGWCYLYFMPFIGLITIPIWFKKMRSAILWGLIGIITLSGNLIWLYAHTSEMLNVPTPPLINGQTLTTIHSATVDSFWSGTPIDISNQISIIWMMAVCIGGYRLWGQQRRHFWMGTVSILLGLGLIAGTHLPFLDLFSHLPFMSRLLWPERFGILIAIGMIVLVSSVPKARWLIPLACIEFTVRSGNLPLHTTSLEPWQCLRSLESADQSSVLELPLKDGDSLYNQQSLRQRFHQRPLVNPFILPPFVQPPTKWTSIQRMPALQAIDGELPFTTIHLSDLQAMDIGTILIDRVLLSASKQKQIRRHLSSTLGDPIDLQCAYVWPLNDQTITPNNDTSPLPYSRPIVNSTQEPL